MKKQLFTLIFVAITLFSCKKETTANPIDNSIASDYYLVESKTVTQRPTFFEAKILIKVSNSSSISTIQLSKVPFGFNWNLLVENSTQSKTFADAANVFTGQQFKVIITLKNGRILNDTFIY